MYELRRLIWNKFFLGLVIINGIYAWYILTTDIIVGVGYTAPFSLWSYSAYLACVMPVSILTVLFLLSIYYSKKEKHVEILTKETPVNQTRYTFVRIGAVSICFFLICAVMFLISIYFYISIFSFKNFTPFLLPAVIVLVPCYFFTIGVGCIAGRIHQSLLYILMLVAALIGFAGLGGSFDFFGRGYFNVQPVSLPAGLDGEPAFTISIWFWIARVGYLAAGIILLIIYVFRSTRIKSLIHDKRSFARPMDGL
jgi:ABC-2 type transport system permease protein